MGKGTAEAEQTVGERLATQGELGGKQGDEAEHGHAAIELLGTLMETPAVVGGDNLHAGLGCKGVETAAVFGGYLGAADSGGLAHGVLRFDVLMKL